MTMANQFFQQDPNNEAGQCFDLGLFGICAYLFFSNFAEHCDNRLEKSGQHKLSVSQCIFALLLQFLSGENYSGLSGVPALISKLPFGVLTDDPDFQIESMNRYVLSDTLDRIAMYGSSKLMFEASCCLVPKEILDEACSFHIDITSFRSFAKLISVDSVNLMPIDSVEIGEEKHKLSKLAIEVYKALRRPIGETDSILHIRKWMEENLVQGQTNISEAQIAELMNHLRQYFIADISHIFLLMGYSRDYAPHLPQGCVWCSAIKTSSGEVAFPLAHGFFSGNVNDIKEMQIITKFELEKLKSACPNVRFVVGDSASFSRTTIANVLTHDMHLITRVPDQKSPVKQAFEDFKNHKILMQDMTVKKGNGTEEVVKYAWLPFYYLQEQGQKTIPLKLMLANAESLRGQKTATILKKAENEKQKMLRRFKKLSNPKHGFACKADLYKAISEACKDMRFTSIDKVEVKENESYANRGHPSKNSLKKITYTANVSVILREDIIAQAIEQELLYVIASTDKSISAERMYEIYHEQSSVEGCFKEYKTSGLFTDAMFLKKPHRIQALYAIGFISLTLSRVILHHYRKYLKTHKQKLTVSSSVSTDTPSWHTLVRSKAVRSVSISVRDKSGVAIHGADNSNPEFLMLLNAIGEPCWKYYKCSFYSGYSYQMLTQLTGDYDLCKLSTPTAA